MPCREAVTLLLAISFVMFIMCVYRKIAYYADIFFFIRTFGHIIYGDIS